MQTQIIPKPSRFITGEGTFSLHPSATVSWEGPGVESVAELLADYLRPATGYEVPVHSGETGTIHLKAEGAGEQDEAGFVEESYALQVTKDGVSLQAPNATGLARGIQTLRQLFPPAILRKTPQQETWELPCVDIQDSPRLRWRGLMLDVSRYFFSVEDVCELIDTMALHRLNIFHLHLTDDPGWRIEIKQYPKLTEIGSRRECTLVGHLNERPRQFDQTPYGGYYTQEDIKEIVAFASRRHITLVPEIDMPGHMCAAIAAYPELGNVPGVDVRCMWGISQHILNVEESTVRFMKNVLDEVMDLFPGRFIHIGGDEVPIKEWSESRRAQARMAELGLTSDRELQSWFIQQMDHHLTAAGRRLIGWDEILEGGLADGATVMSWRGNKGGLEAAGLGQDVVMAPHQRVYFDYPQTDAPSEPLTIGGLCTLDNVYTFKPVPDDMPEDQRHHVLGAQGQLWTEYISSREKLNYMGFPRICALAEVLWLSEADKNYDDFLKRLPLHRQRLKALNIQAHPLPS